MTRVQGSCPMKGKANGGTINIGQVGLHAGGVPELQELFVKHV